jgi:hypothetical protein
VISAASGAFVWTGTDADLIFVPIAIPIVDLTLFDRSATRTLQDRSVNLTVKDR